MGLLRNVTRFVNFAMGGGQSSSRDQDELEQMERRRLRHSLDNRDEQQQLDDRVVVDSSSLQCPICYNLYPTGSPFLMMMMQYAAPLLLECGHSFCTACISHVVDLAKKPGAASTSSIAKMVLDQNHCRYVAVRFS